MAVRLQKILAAAGLGSRRACEEFIEAGRVRVNGQLVRKLGSTADPLTDRITFDGRPVEAQQPVYLAFHKPRRFLCSRRSQGGKATVYDLLPPAYQSLFTVGRLDFDSEGLLFLTNDGAFALRVTHPRHQVVKRYRVTVKGRVAARGARRLEEGVRSRGERLKAVSARVLKSRDSGSEVEVDLVEGRNREVRRMFDVLGCPVVRLQRTRIGGVPLGELPAGRHRHLGAPEIRMFLPEDDARAS